MKKILSILIMSYAMVAAAQSGTTLDEYRYLTKGYAYQKEMGLDAVKEGYQFRSLFEHENGIQFIGMYRDHAAAPQAVLAILTNGSQHTYICLPNNGSSKEIEKMYENDLRNKLVTSAQKQEFDEARRGLLFTMMGDRSSANPAVARVQPGIGEVEITSKGIPVQPYDYQQLNVPPANSQAVNVSNTEMVANKNVSASVGGELTGRTLVNVPAVYGDYTPRGKVVIKICVDETGEITSAKFTQRGSTTFNPELKKLALDSALTTRFGSSEVKEQCGVISYHFK